MASRDYEKYLNVVWCFIALWMAYHTFLQIWVMAEMEPFVWFFLHGLTAVLFLVRKKPIHYSSSVMGYCVSLASVHYYFLYDFTVSVPSFWGFFGKGVTGIGGLLCIASTLSLGRCFGILPIYRGVETRAMYQFIRHPIYLSYLVLDAGILMTYFTFANFLIFLIAVLLFIVRIRYEEDVLQLSDAYWDYKRKVKYKLIPGVY
ncbi:MAG: hypothetical protein HQM14_01745 [SAR324 cluster bacterium]|nr:hypothetical protein [SAR324 cluster bacterium]